MTKAGVKTEDYREINGYWTRRLFDVKMKPTWGINDFIREFEYHGDELGFAGSIGKRFEYNVITLGYPSKEYNERILKLEHKGIEIRTGNPEWGAIPDKLYFVIKHGTFS